MVHLLQNLEDQELVWSQIMPPLIPQSCTTSKPSVKWHTRKISVILLLGKQHIQVMWPRSVKSNHLSLWDSPLAHLSKWEIYWIKEDRASIAPYANTRRWGYLVTSHLHGYHLCDIKHKIYKRKIGFWHNRFTSYHSFSSVPPTSAYIPEDFVVKCWIMTELPQTNEASPDLVPRTKQPLFDCLNNSDAPCTYQISRLPIISRIWSKCLLNKLCTPSRWLSYNQKVATLWWSVRFSYLYRICSYVASINVFTQLDKLCKAFKV